MEEQKMSADQEINDIEIEGLTEAEAEQVREIFKRFLKAYKESGEEQETFEWLENQLKQELPEKSDDEILELKESIIDAILEYDADLNSMRESIEQGSTKEKWFADRMEEGAKGVAVNTYGNYLNEINQTMDTANQQMLRTILRKDGGISECLNLDGFIAEQYHVNNFNAKAALQKSNFRAEVCVPNSGETYAKNSMDVRIKNIKTKDIVHQYQFKFGTDAQATKHLLESEDYHNQRYLVPSEQLDELQAAFPTKTVTDRLGGTDKVNIESEPLTKADVKQMQNGVQQEGMAPRTDWNVYNTRELAINLGKQAGVAGMQAAFLTTGLALAGKAMKGEQIDGGEVVETALKSGADVGIKAAAGGALTVASEKGILSIIPQETPAGTLAKIACVGIENIKIMFKVAKGELTVSEALELMGRTSTSMIAGLCMTTGAAVGAAALSWIPIVGPIAGSLIGGLVGYAAGSKFGENVFNGAKKVFETGKKVVKKAWEGIKSVGRGIKELIFG